MIHSPNKPHKPDKIVVTQDVRIGMNKFADRKRANAAHVADMRGLLQAHGTAFDRMFPQMIVSHHQGAVPMAKTELVSQALAQRIVDSPTAEIA
ncbi:DUF305 domain-containing protein [Amycolatopsis sp. FDAARGOS 1241]|nr:DUF305 domain-containing protein [Amycolatopsis sp. FDAARGOS 1241]